MKDLKQLLRFRKNDRFIQQKNEPFLITWRVISNDWHHCLRKERNLLPQSFSVQSDFYNCTINKFCKQNFLEANKFTSWNLTSRSIHKPSQDVSWGIGGIFYLLTCFTTMAQFELTKIFLLCLFESKGFKVLSKSVKYSRVRPHYADNIYLAQIYLI